MWQKIDVGSLKGNLSNDFSGMQMSNLQIPFGEYTLSIMCSFQKKGVEKGKSLTLSNLSIFKNEEDITYDVFQQSVVLNSPENMIIAMKFLNDKI